MVCLNFTYKRSLELGLEGFEEICADGGGVFGGQLFFRVLVVEGECEVVVISVFEADFDDEVLSGEEIDDGADCGLWWQFERKVLDNGGGVGDGSVGGVGKAYRQQRVKVQLSSESAGGDWGDGTKGGLTCLGAALA